MSKPKVLVFDDSEANRQSAKLTLGEHCDLTIVGTYDEAQAALTPQVDQDKFEELLPDLLVKAGFKSDATVDAVGRENTGRYFEARRETIMLATSYPDFDVVMTDLFVPPSLQAQSDPKRFDGQAMPVGTTIALLALYSGAKKVAVVTDENHHNHPASAAFDCFESAKYTLKDSGVTSAIENVCKADSVKLICTNRVSSIMIDKESGEMVTEEFYRSEEGKAKYPRQGYKLAEAIMFGKDWKTVFDQLMV